MQAECPKPNPVSLMHTNVLIADSQSFCFWNVDTFDEHRQRFDGFTMEECERFDEVFNEHSQAPGEPGNWEPLGAPGIATRSKDATRGTWPYY